LTREELKGAFLADLITVLVIAFVMAFFFSGLFKTKRIKLSFLFTFFIMLLVSWGAYLWIKPVGPAYGGVSLIPVSFVSLLIGLLVLAYHESHSFHDDLDKHEVAREAAGILGLFFWIFILTMALPIIISYLWLPII